MPRPSKLSPEAVQTALLSLSGWQGTESNLHRKFEFKDFIDAWGFMSRAALVAQAMDHHPDWSNVYRTVDVTLSTHDAGGVTELDIKLAQEMNRLAGS